jgi:transposase
MFIRKLKNSSGKTYIQVIDKSSGKYKVLKSIGSSKDVRQIEKLIQKGNDWIHAYTGKLEFDFTREEQFIEALFNSIDSHKLIGLELLLGRLFDEIGFNEISDEIFRQLVIYRIAFPKSKLKTTQYLYRYEHIDWNEDMLYRYLDKLHFTQKERVQQISYKHTLKILDNTISIVFYDVTTLYFEIDQEDELRKTGFSKEGKHQNPQIVLGLLVSKNGYPLAYDIFEGNKFEGHTMLPIIEAFKRNYNLEKLVVIADSGLLSNDNIQQLQNKQYEFILGARIKNESAALQQKILGLKLKNGESACIQKGDLKLIITYSDNRARKDAYNREKGIRRLEKQIRRGKLTKAAINKRGYNKFLKLEAEVAVCIDKLKIEQDRKWDGLKGYITNTTLSNDEAIENYRHLWQIEKAFRITKTDLKVRPIYHRLPRRIEAHICISFAAYKVYKELERQLQEKKSTLTPMQAIEIAENIFEIQLELPFTKTRIKKILLLTKEQKLLAKTFNFGC